MKKIFYSALFIITAFCANAQVKIGSAPTAIVSGARVQVDGDATTTVANPAKMIVASSGYIGMGTSLPSQILDIVATGGQFADNVNLTSYGGAGANGYPQFLLRCASGTLASPGFLLGSQVQFSGFLSSAYNGSGFSTTAGMAMYTTEAHSASGLGTAIGFFTTFNGSTINGERMRLDQNGYLGIGTTQPTSRLQVVGLPVYASDAAAASGGLTAGAFFQDSSGIVHIKQ